MSVLDSHRKQTEFLKFLNSDCNTKREIRKWLLIKETFLRD